MFMYNVKRMHKLDSDTYFRTVRLFSNDFELLMLDCVYESNACYELETIISIDSAYISTMPVKQ